MVATGAERASAATSASATAGAGRGDAGGRARIRSPTSKRPSAEWQAWHCVMWVVTRSRSARESLSSTYATSSIRSTGHPSAGGRPCRSATALTPRQDAARRVMLHSSAMTSSSVMCAAGSESRKRARASAAALIWCSRPATCSQYAYTTAP